MTGSENADSAIIVLYLLFTRWRLFVHAHDGGAKADYLRVSHGSIPPLHVHSTFQRPHGSVDNAGVPLERRLCQRCDSRAIYETSGRLATCQSLLNAACHFVGGRTSGAWRSGRISWWRGRGRDKPQVRETSAWHPKGYYHAAIPYQSPKSTTPKLPQNFRNAGRPKFPNAHLSTREIAKSYHCSLFVTVSNCR